MPGGLDARIAQGGTNVSGGQRQRLAIARALVRAPGDLPLRRLVLGPRPRHRRPAAGRPPARTPPTPPWSIVAQRVSTIRDADQILVLEDGRPGRASAPTTSSSATAPPTPRSSSPSTRKGRRDRRRDRSRGKVAAGRPAAAQSCAVRRRMAAAGMPVEKPEDFAGATRRLAGACRPDERRWVILVIVLGGHQRHPVRHRPEDPRRGHRHHRRRGHRPDRRHRLRRRCTVSCSASWSSTSCSSVLAYAPGLHAGRRGPADDAPPAGRRRGRSSTASPSATSTASPAATSSAGSPTTSTTSPRACSRRLSQMLTAVLTIVGVLVMMFTISPLLRPRGPGHRADRRCGPSASSPTAPSPGSWPSGRHTGSLNAQVEEAFTGHALVKVFGRQQDVEDRFNETNEELFEAGFGAQFIAGAIQPVMMFLGNLNFVAIAVVGGLRVASGALSIGDVQAFIQYSRQFTQPLTQLASMIERPPVRHRLRRAGVRAARRRRAGRRPGVDRRRRPAAAPGRVEFDHVTVLLRPGQAAHHRTSRWWPSPARPSPSSGPTGAGKTTLVNLIMRFYELDGGRHHPRRDATSPRCSRRSLRADIGMVLQDTWLFGGTIRDNIAYGNLDATEEQIREAARADLRRPLRALAARRLRHGDRRRGRQRQRRARSSCSRSPGPSWPTRPSSSSTRPPARSTPAPRC